MSTACLRASRSVAEALERRILLSFAAAGVEFRVNGTTTDSQTAPVVAIDGDGEFVVAWQSAGSAVFARRYDASGSPQGGEFQLNTFTPSTQRDPSIAMDADGDFVAAWESNSQDGSGYGVFARRYTAGGVAHGAEFLVNTTTAGTQSSPAAAMAADGSFVVAWSGAGADDTVGVFARRYSADGIAQGGEFRVNTYTTNNQAGAAIAMDASGDFVIAWAGAGLTDSSGSGVFAQRYGADGIPHGGEFRVNTFTTSTQDAPSVAADMQGNFVIAWQSLGQDGSGLGVYAQRYDAAGAPLGSEFKVHGAFIGNDQGAPDTAMDADGDFLVSWQSDNQDGSAAGIYAKHFDSDGTPLTGEFRVNTFVLNSQTLPSVAMTPAGDAIFAWSSVLQDGSLEGVYAQRYDESTDSAGPLIGGVFINGARVEPYSSHESPLQQILASFSENMTDAGGPGGANSVTNPANWLLTRNGVDVTSSISGIAYGFNLAANRYEATINLMAPYTGGNFLLMARDNLRDIAGNRLDGNLDAAPGGNLLLPFSVVGRGPRGPELQVNTFTTGFQFEPSVAMDDAGNFAVVFASSDLGAPNVAGRLFNRSGAPLGDEFNVNSTRGVGRQDPVVAMDADGDFVVAWWTYSPNDTIEGTYFQRYNASGAPQGIATLVNNSTLGLQDAPAIVMDEDGNFVIAFRTNDGSSDGIAVRRFDSSGTPFGNEFPVNSFTTGLQNRPSIAMDDAGNFVIAWQSTGNESAGNVGIYARRFNATGVPQGLDFHVNTYTTDLQNFPNVAMKGSGEFVVAWQSKGQDGSEYGVYARRYDASGAPQGGEIPLSTYTLFDQKDPSVAIEEDGEVTVAWESEGQDGDAFGVYARRFTAAGVPLADEFRVNTYTTASQREASVAVTPDGDFVVSWASSTQDSSTQGVYAQRFGIDQTPTVGALADNPDPVVAGNSITLSASSVSDDSAVASVSFYRESNGEAGLQVGAFGDTFLGTDTTQVGGVWALNVPTSSLASQTYTYWAQATDDAGLTGVPASTTNTVIGGAPVVTNAQFLFETAPQHLTFTFDQNVSASLSASDFTGIGTPGVDYALSYDFGTNTATLTFTHILADGRYTATVVAAGVTNASGTPMAANYQLPFLFLRGDADNDGDVDVNDLGILASNWQQSPRTFSQADFDYSGTVDVNDLGILASHWQQNLAPPSAPAARRGHGRTIDQIFALLKPVGGSRGILSQ